MHFTGVCNENGNLNWAEENDNKTEQTKKGKLSKRKWQFKLNENDTTRTV